MKEKLSALIDNELSVEQREAMIDRLLSDSELQQSWEDTYTASELMSHAASQRHLASKSFADRVGTAIESEPTVFAPNAHNKRSSASDGTNQADTNAFAIPQPVRRSGFGPVYALAASLALMAVLLVAPQFNRSTTDTDSVATLTPSPVQILDSNEVEALMVEHGEFTGMGALNGLLAYAKVVNAESSAE